jgi:hypothetical protein
VLGACKKVLSDVKSESKCTIESDQRMCWCRVTKPRCLPIADFHWNILIVSSCIILEHNMNYQNALLCSDCLMKEWKIYTSS